MAERGNGGIIGPANVPTNQVATGVWNLEEQQIAKSLGAWPSDYRIQRSLRFNSADSAYLNRTPASAGNRKTWTFSAWVKRSALPGSRVTLFNCFFGSNDNSNFAFLFDENNRLAVAVHTAWLLQTSSVYRDVSAWYHVVVAVDTTQATAANRLKLYVNGTQITAFDTNNLATAVSQNMDLAVNAAQQHVIGRDDLPSNYFPGYMTEVNFIDGQALTPSSFGQTNFDTGVWEPKPYAGTYGTNGFYLNFSDNSNTTATTLGKDYSGNGNNWTPNNFSVSAGAGNDSLVDTPTPYGADTGVGGSVRGNYCTLNPLKIASTATLSNGNLDYLGGSGLTTSFGTIGVSSGKWYFEATPTGTDAVHAMIGVANDSASLTQYPGQNANSWGYYGADGNKYNSGSATAYGAAFGANDVIGVALDMDAGTLTYYKNGVSQGQAFSGLTGTLFPVVGEGGTQQTPAITANFGQRPFAYTAPSGFKALCTQNLPTPTIGATASTQAGKFFNPVLYTGNGSARSITGVGFQPDFTWIKERSSTSGNTVTDVVRGTSKNLVTEITAAEGTSTNVLTSFNTDGFSLGTDNSINENSQTYVAWNWKANGAGVTNTSGSITSTVSANTTSGFSVVTWTCPAGASDVYTVGHGLGAAPKMIIIKSRNGAYNWFTWNIGLGDNTTDYLTLNTTNAEGSSAGMWGAVGRNSAVMGFTNGVSTVANNTMVAYVFSEVPGFSKFGIYTGNGSSDGPFVYCGFRPAFVLVKRLEANNDGWYLADSKRSPENNVTKLLSPNDSAAEQTYTAFNFVSNGFKLINTGSGVNASGGTYIFAAFAEFPQKFSLAR